MIQRHDATAAALIVLVALGGGIGMWLLLGGKANEPSKSTAPPVPAKVDKPVNEEQISRFSLKPEAEDALKLQFGKVEFKPVPRSRFYGGEVTVPPGQTIIVAAPFSGVLQTVKGVLPQAGMPVHKGDLVFNLVPLLTAEGRANLASALVEAQGQINNAESQKKATFIVRERARMLLMDDAGSKRQFDDADAAYELALSVLKAAQDRKKKLEELAGDADKNTATALPIVATGNGILRNVTAAHDQNVPGGAVLFEVLDISTVWVRVPIHVGDEAELVPDGSALVGRLTARPERIGPPAKDKEKLVEAKRVQAPPSANAIAGSVDVWFMLDNSSTQYRPGQRVGVTLALQSEPDSLTVPWSAVIHDIHGGTWVYEPLGNHTFIRHRVNVRYVRDGVAALANGPPKGTTVVSAGAAELYGTETGFSK
jgi:membrane fusion protein, heavy metal efflux system